MATPTTALSFAIACQLSLQPHHAAQQQYQTFRRRSPYFYHFTLFRHHVTLRSRLRWQIIRMWANQHLRVGFESFKRNAHVAKILLKAMAYLQHSAFSTWKTYILFERAQEIAAYMLDDEAGAVRGTKSAFRQWKRGIVFFQRERDLTRVAIHKYRTRCHRIRTLFHDWLVFIVERRRARCRIASVSSLWVRNKYRQRFDRWSDVSRRIGVRRRRKLQDACALWTQATVLRCLRGWAQYNRKLKMERKKAIGNWKNKSTSKCFRTWVKQVRHAVSERLRQKTLIASVMAAMVHRHVFVCFNHWVNVVDEYNVMGEQHYQQLQELSPNLEMLFEHVKEDIDAHDQQTASFRQSWNDWSNPLDGAVQEMVVERSQYGTRWVAREVIDDGQGNVRSSRSGVQVSSRYREPLRVVGDGGNGGNGGNGGGKSATIALEGTLEGASEEQLTAYRNRYKREHQAHFAKNAAERARKATQLRRQKEMEQMELEKNLEATRRRDGVVEDSAFSYAFDYYTYLGDSKRLDSRSRRDVAEEVVEEVTVKAGENEKA